MTQENKPKIGQLCSFWDTGGTECCSDIGELAEIDKYGFITTQSRYYRYCRPLIKKEISHYMELAND